MILSNPLCKNPCPRGHKIYNFRRPFLGHHYYILSMSDPCPRAEKKLLGWGGHENDNFLSPYPTAATDQIWLRLVALKKNMLMDNAQRKMDNT